VNDFLITGIKSGLGKYLHINIPGSQGLSRVNFDSLSEEGYNTIVHCAFNKEYPITDYKKYMEDNIFLTQKLKALPHKYFVYISTVDVYQTSPTVYALFKRFAESLLDSYDLILRCPMMFGDTMKPNHATKLKANIGRIGISGESTFNYILMQDILRFITTGDYRHYSGVIDFVSEDIIELKEVKRYFNSTIELGVDLYTNSMSNYKNPIFNLDSTYRSKSYENLVKYFSKYD